MAMNKAYLAIDLGAESGRAMLGTLGDDGRLALRELHRFSNTPQRLSTGLHWNLPDLWSNLLEGLRRAAAVSRDERLQLVSIGVDTWGVDYGLIDASGQWLGPPFAYRDERNVAAMEKVIAAVGRPRLFDVTGIQIMPFNTLFQVAAQSVGDPGILDRADKLLFMPDLLHYLLSGESANEATIASTSQMINPRFGDGLGRWATDLLDQLHLTTRMLGRLVPAGTRLGPLRREVTEQTGAAGVAVTVPAGHDTACAVAAVPADPATSWCYLSSGTWSLLGVELAQPLISESVRTAELTNERGVGGRICFLRNLPAGLWLVQKIRQSLEKAGQSYDYATLTALAESAEPFRTLVDPNHPSLVFGGDDMVDRMRQVARAAGQPEPQEAGELVRGALESLALSDREAIEQLERVTGRRLDVLHIVGGGARNALLCQMRADATGRDVLAGPFEATAAGNVLIQAMGAGEIGSPDEIRRVVARSFEPVAYRPRRQGDWDKAYERFRGMREQPPTGNP
jgi:rhamnulokinase